MERIPNVCSPRTRRLPSSTGDPSQVKASRHGRTPSSHQSAHARADRSAGEEKEGEQGTRARTHDPHTKNIRQRTNLGVPSAETIMSEPLHQKARRHTREGKGLGKKNRGLTPRAAKKGRTSDGLRTVTSHTATARPVEQLERQQKKRKRPRECCQRSLAGGCVSEGAMPAGADSRGPVAKVKPHPHIHR